MFRLEKTVDGVTVVADIKSHAVNLIDLQSGSGKSLYAQLLVKACNYSRIDSILINYANFWNIYKQLSIIAPSGIVILDNAELYTDKIVNCLNSTKATILIISRFLPWELIDMPTAHMTAEKYRICVKEI